MPRLLIWFLPEINIVRDPCRGPAQQVTAADQCDSDKMLPGICKPRNANHDRENDGDKDGISSEHAHGTSRSSPAPVQRKSRQRLDLLFIEFQEYRIAESITHRRNGNDHILLPPQVSFPHD